MYETRFFFIYTLHISLLIPTNFPICFFSHQFWGFPPLNICVNYGTECTHYRKESEVTQLCPTLRDPMDCCLPGSSVHGDSPDKNHTL